MTEHDKEALRAAIALAASTIYWEDTELDTRYESLSERKIEEIILHSLREFLR